MAQTDNTEEGAATTTLKLSSSRIVIDPETHRSEIVVCNLHHKYTIYFKIKTRIEKLYDVKPCIGAIQPQQQLTIAFRSINKIYHEEITNIEQNLIFLLQAVNHTNPALSKQDEQTLWKDIKARRANIELGYYSAKLPVIFSTDKSQQTQYLPPIYKPTSSKIESSYSSDFGRRINSSTKHPRLTYSHFMRSDHKRQSQVYEQELQKKYEDLNKKQRLLIEERSKLIDQTPLPKKRQGACPIKIIAILLLAFIMGNLLCYLMLPLQLRAAYFQKLDWLHEWFV